MVMAESERESRHESSTNSASRLQWLRQRREALQEKLVKKNNELKNLCIDEAELTGVLPPEIPLDPGESPPLFRRRVGTSFAYPQNLINKLKTSQAEESALELERQIQTAIAKKAYVIFNDPAETKAVRRKHRLVYQQSQGRLKDLEIRLTFIRQGYGRFHRRSNVENTQWQQSSSVGDDEVALAIQNNVKHRSKKPRPPLGIGPDRLQNSKMNSDSTIKNNVIDQLNVGSDWQHNLKHNHKDNGWVANGPISSCINSGSDSAIVHDFNDNADMYILADQCRARTYSHGNSDDGDSRHARHYQMIERGYHTLSSGHADEDEQSIVRRNNIWSREQKRQYETYHYNQRQQQQQANAFRQQPQKYHRNYHQDHLPPTTNVSPSMQSYPESLDQQISTSAGGSRGRYAYHPSGQYSHSQHSDDNRRDVQLSRPQEFESVQDRNSRRDSHEAMTMSRHEMRNANDNWIVPDDEEPTWHSERSIPQPDNRFGSIDRRKQNDDNLSTINVHRYQTTSQEMAASTHPTTPVPPRYIKPPPSIENKTISKYSNNQQQQNIRMERVEPQTARTLLRTQSLGSVENWHSVAAANTITTTCASPVITATITTMQPTTAAAGSVHRVYNRDNYISYRENGKEWYETSMDFTYPKSPSAPNPPKNLEIPAESSRLSTRREIDGNFEATNLGSPEKLTADGRTIVHAGKYQPYKEVTKPFEMSDFYKYSTKFRKKVEPTTVNPGQTTHIHSTGSNIIPIIASENNNKSNNNDIELNCDTTIDCRQQISTSHAPLVQRRICNSAQSMPGQPYIAVRVDDNNIRDWSNTQASQPSTKDSTVV